MVIDELVLENVGVFRGRQSLKLTPYSDRPITLIGGFNGSGKTTILEAINLALYGPLARTSRRSGSYEDYLRSLTNRMGDPDARVELEFHAYNEGDLTTYRICRSWSVAKPTLRERLDVQVNGSPDANLSSTWAEHIEAFLPRGIAGLFFFDGEQVEALADLDTSQAVLKVALSSLLGLQLVDRLSVDLAVIKRRRSKHHVPEKLSKRIDICQARAISARQQSEDVAAEVARARVNLERANKKLFDASERYRTAGGELSEQRDEIELRLRELMHDIGVANDSLREIAAGPAPLALVKPLLRRLARRAQEERAREVTGLIVEAIRERDAETLKHLSRADVTIDVIVPLERYLREDRAARINSARGERIADLKDSLQINQLLDATLSQEMARIQNLIQERRRLLADRDSLDRLLAAVPDLEAVSIHRDALESARLEALRCEGAVGQIEDRLAAARNERSRAEEAYEKALDEVASTVLAADDDRRVLEHIDRVQATLRSLRVTAAQRHLGSICELVLDSLRLLLRKERLIAGLSIDPESYVVELTGSDGQPLAPRELSAGERQLMAVALLWGLARSAGQPLPVVIDTPLGRLDQTHRQHLIDHYFPKVSHQVILLSTDTEVDQAVLKRLNGNISHLYRLDFDDASGTSHVSGGYFWET